jgi:hypothetical protein
MKLNHIVMLFVCLPVFLLAVYFVVAATNGVL